MVPKVTQISQFRLVLQTFVVGLQLLMRSSPQSSSTNHLQLEIVPL